MVRVSAAIDPSANEPGGATSPRGTDLAVVVIALVTLSAVVVGLADGAAGYAVVAPLGAVAVVGGTSLLSARRLSLRAIGSCGFVAGLVAAVAAPIHAGSVVLPIATVATIAVGFALVPRPCRSAPVRRVFLDSSVLLIVCALLVSVVAVGLIGFVDAFHVLSSAPTAFDALLTLQLLALATVPFSAAAGATVERRLTGAGSEPGRAFRERLEDVPSGVSTAVGIQVFAWLVFRPGALVESALSSLGPVGLAVSAAATSGYGHGVLLAICFGAGAVVAADRVRPLLEAWLEPVPLRTLAFASGGPMAVLLVAGRFVATGTVGDQSTGVIALIVLGVAIAVVAGLFPSADDGSPLAGRWRSAGLALGVGGALVATLVAAVRGLHPVGVFAGVALALFAWDVGSNVLSFRRQVGPEIDTREPELVRAAASLLVGGVGVAVAAAALYVVGGAAPPSRRWQAIAPIAAALVAIVAAVAVLEWWPDSVSARERVSAGGKAVAAWMRGHPVTVVAGLAFAAVLVASPPGAAVLVVFLGVPVAILVVITHYSSESWDSWDLYR